MKFWCLSVIPGDLCATDITMGDEDRKTLMMMVKDGSLSTEQAMAMVSVGLIFVKFQKKKIIFFYLLSISSWKRIWLGKGCISWMNHWKLEIWREINTCIPFDKL